MPRTIPSGYESKYAEFIQLCAKARNDNVEHVVIAAPWVLNSHTPGARTWNYVICGILLAGIAALHAPIAELEAGGHSREPAA